MSNETRSYQDETPNPACPAHRQHCHTSDALLPNLPRSAAAFPGSTHQASGAVQATIRTTSSPDMCPSHVAVQVHPSLAMAAAGHSPHRRAAWHTHSSQGLWSTPRPRSKVPITGLQARPGVGMAQQPSRHQAHKQNQHISVMTEQTACTRLGMGWNVPAVSTGRANALGCAQTPTHLSQAHGSYCGSLRTGNIYSVLQQGDPRWGQ